MNAKEKVEELLRRTGKLFDVSYQSFMCDAFDISRPGEVQRAIVKLIHKRGAKSARNTGTESGVVQGGTPATCPSPNTGTSAWQTPFIFRGDLIPKGGNLYLDVEKLSLKIKKFCKKHKQVASIVALVNDEKKLVFWAFVCCEADDICQTFPKLTGVEKSKLKNGLTRDEVKRLLGIALNGNKVVGFDLENDLKSLDINHDNKEDLQEYFQWSTPDPNDPDRSLLSPYKLKDLADHLRKVNFQCGKHSAIIDARMTRDLFMKKEELLNAQPTFQEHVQRSAKTKYFFDPFDKCMCKK